MRAGKVVLFMLKNMLRDVQLWIPLTVLVGGIVLLVLFH